LRLADPEPISGGRPHKASTDFYTNTCDQLSCKQDADSDGLGEQPTLPVLLPIFGQGHWHTATKKDQGTTS